MSITDELRQVAAKTEEANGRCGKLYRGDLDRIADRIDAELAERYVALPVDADGVTIRVGDKMTGWASLEFPDPGGDEVWGLLLLDDGWRVENDTVNRKPCKLRHYHEPTVEDVLREFAEEWSDSKTRFCENVLLVEYAKRLRLAGDGE